MTRRDDGTPPRTTGEWAMSSPELARVPAAPLRYVIEQSGRTHETLAINAGSSVIALRRVIYDQDRLTQTQAERIADALGIAPSTIWPDWAELTGVLVYENTPWKRRARCRAADTTLFFGPPGEQPREREAREWDIERRFCSQCAVRAECRDFAIRHCEWGYWGSTERERSETGAPPPATRRDITRPSRVQRSVGVKVG